MQTITFGPKNSKVKEKLTTESQRTQRKNNDRIGRMDRIGGRMRDVLAHFKISSKDFGMGREIPHPASYPAHPAYPVNLFFLSVLCDSVVNLFVVFW